MKKDTFNPSRIGFHRLRRSEEARDDKPYHNF